MSLLQRKYYWKGAKKLLAMGFEEGMEMVGVTIMVLAAYRILAYVLSSEPDTESELESSRGWALRFSDAIAWHR